MMPWQETRSGVQNKRMWAMLGDLSEQLRWPVDGVMTKLEDWEWKILITAGLKREQRIAAGIDGGFVMLGQRTSKMTIPEMSELMELMAAFGAERDVAWTEPKRETA